MKENLNSVHDIVKDNTQMLKMISGLDIELNEEQKNIYYYEQGCKTNIR